LFSESTALNSRSNVDSKKSGDTKNWANRSRAPYNGDLPSDSPALLDEVSLTTPFVPFVPLVDSVGVFCPVDFGALESPVADTSKK
jgi:hypothetical protein